jgi:hypothetical protein
VDPFEDWTDEEPEVESDEPDPEDVYEFEPEDDTRGDA